MSSNNELTRTRRLTPRVGAVMAMVLLGATVSIGSAAAGVTGPADPLGTLPTSAGSLGPSTLGGPITQDQILARAKDWINQSVMYSTAQESGSDWNYWTDSATGGPYRQDCSGFVSMAWGLSSSLATPTLPGVSTVTDSNISGDTGLQSGDALDYTADHVVLFDHWTDSSGDFAYDAEHTEGEATDQRDASIYDSSLESYAISDFEALRYKNLTGTESGGTGQSSTQIGHGWSTATKKFDAIDNNGTSDIYVIDSSDNLQMYTDAGNGTTVGGPTYIGDNWGSYKPIGGVNIGGINMLYAINTSTGYLWVFTATSSAGTKFTSHQIGAGWASYTPFGVVANGSEPDLYVVNSSGELEMYPGTSAGQNFGTPVASGQNFGSLTPFSVTNVGGDIVMLGVDSSEQLWQYTASDSSPSVFSYGQVGHGWSGFTSLGADSMNGGVDLFTYNADGTLFLYVNP